MSILFLPEEGMANVRNGHSGIFIIAIRFEMALLSAKIWL